MAANYLPKDRYRDFRKVFGPDEGKRVFNEILSWGHMYQSSLTGNPIDPLILSSREGERNIALKLLSTYNDEPKEKSKKTTSVKPKRSQ